MICAIIISDGIFLIMFDSSIPLLVGDIPVNHVYTHVYQYIYISIYISFVQICIYIYVIYYVYI